MKWVGVALVSEGPTDDRFLPGVIGRSLEDLLAREFDDYVLVGEVIPVQVSGGPAAVKDYVSALRDNVGSFNIVVFHHDSGANPNRVAEQWIDPMRREWSERGTEDPITFLVPVRETEAWALADGDALRRVFGVSWSDDELGIPANPRNVAGVTDPKKVIDGIVTRTSGRRADYHTRLGELVDLNRLAAVDAYAEWLRSVEQQLESSLNLKRIASRRRGR